MKVISRHISYAWAKGSDVKMAKKARRIRSVYLGNVGIMFGHCAQFL